MYCSCSLWRISCDLDEIIYIAKNNLIVIEDAAQAIGSKYKNKSLVQCGIWVLLVFIKQNITCGEGGAFYK